MDEKQYSEKINFIEKKIIENNLILQTIDRRMKISQYITIVHWVIIIGGAIGLYTFARPFIDKTMEAYNQVQQVTKTVNNIPAILFKR